MSTWINGRAGSSIDASDRGLQYGDGLFETMLVRGRRVRLLDYHLDRLMQGCRRLQIEAPSAAVLRREAVARAGQRSEGVLKLILTRGGGARGYRPTGRETSTRVFSLHGLGSSSAAARAPVRVRVCTARVGLNPVLAGLKTLNRLESVVARAEWSDARVWEGLMLDLDGNVVSGTMSNVFLRRGSTLMTPSLDRCGVAGVMRRWVLEQSARLRLRVWQGRLPLEAIREAEEMFMTNAVAGIVSVGRVEQGRSRIRLDQRETAQRLCAWLELE
jgi:4-amino-4-deoxychorismate lyase